MQLDGLEINLRFSARRKTIGLMVTVDGQVVVTAPRGTSEAKIREALNRHRIWLARKIAASREAWSKLQDGVVYFQGRPYRLTTALGKKAEVTLTPGERAEIKITRPGAAAPVWPILMAWYLRQAAPVFQERATHYAARMGLSFSRIELRDWRRRWGECHPRDGVLRFNWRLILLPGESLDYVVVHELAHLTEPGHTARFWARVGREMPDCAARRGWLNRYGSPFLLWQLF